MTRQEAVYRTNYSVSAKVEGHVAPPWYPNAGELLEFYCDPSNSRIEIRLDNLSQPKLFEKPLPSVISFFDMVDLLGENAREIFDVMLRRNFTHRQLAQLNFFRDGVWEDPPLQHFDIATPLKGGL